jgi:hypothetical protein
VTSAKRAYRCTRCGALSTMRWVDFCDVCGGEAPDQTSFEAGWYIDGGDQPVRRMAEDFRTGWWIGDIGGT